VALIGWVMNIGALKSGASTANPTWLTPLAIAPLSDTRIRLLSSNRRLSHRNIRKGCERRPLGKDVRSAVA
jgi:hypothetical protein